MTTPFKIFGGTSHPALVKNVCQVLGLTQAASFTKVFSNENLLVRIDEDVRGCDCFVIQTASPPLHTNMMELFMFCHTLRSCGAKSICAVMPYFPYIRSDKQDKPGVGIIARLVADLVETSGATRAILLDLHSRQAQGFFKMPTCVVSAADILTQYLKTLDLSQAVLVAPDAGEVKDLVPYTEMLSLPMAIIDKRRQDDNEQAKAYGIVGDIEGKTAILIDDEIATGTTICESAAILKARGAAQIIALCTHPVFSGNAVEQLEKAPIEHVIVTDSLPLRTHAPKLTQLSIAPVLAQAILAHFPPKTE